MAEPCVKCGKTIENKSGMVWSAPIGEPFGWWCVDCHVKNEKKNGTDELEMDAGLAEFLDSLQKRVVGLEHEATNARLYTSQVESHVQKVEKKLEDLLLVLEHSRLGLTLIDGPEEEE